VGNCASTLVQALSAAHRGDVLAGITHLDVDGYAVGDIDVVSAFDVDSGKVGRDLSEAVYAEPNCTTRYVEVPWTGVPVSPGMALDGVSAPMQDVVRVAPECNSTSVADVARVLAETSTRIILLYVPVGAERAASAYASAALAAGCSLVNFTPAELATSRDWPLQFEKAGKVLLGDDTKSQIGSTVIHRALLSLLRAQGVDVVHTYQVNVGGNTDFKNMKDPERAASKVRTKLAALHAVSGEDRVPIVATPTEYIPALRDFKTGYIVIEGTGLLGMPVSIEVTLRVEDSPNAAAVAVNAIRVGQVAEDRGLSGTVDSVCALLFKNPPRPMEDAEAARAFDAFVEASRTAAGRG
jgi:myo-inositol-1-phosphate synthase